SGVKQTSNSVQTGNTNNVQTQANTSIAPTTSNNLIVGGVWTSSSFSYTSSNMTVLDSLLNLLDANSAGIGMGDAYVVAAAAGSQTVNQNVGTNQFLWALAASFEPVITPFDSFNISQPHASAWPQIVTI